MKKRQVLGYVFFGFIISIFLQNIFSEKSYASEESESKILNYKDTSYKDNNLPNNYPYFISAAENAIECVVHIKSKYISDELYGYYDPFYGKRFFKQPKENFASGSGVIISNDGYIITNRHVINNAKEIEVVLNDKRTYSAEILGQDSNSDLALLKIDEKDLNFMQFDNSNELKVGEWVLAVGNPYNLNSTVTAGIISAKSRKINILNDGGIESFIQTDAAINSGNSGGALVNLEGKLIGINTAIQSKTGSFSGYGFAIPSNMVKKIITDLKEYGEVKRAYLGIYISDINAQIQKELKLKNLEGVLISKVLENSAADKSGIKDLDIIVKINDIAVNSTNQLHEVVIQYNPGDEIECTVVRGDKTKRFKLLLGS